MRAKMTYGITTTVRLSARIHRVVGLSPNYNHCANFHIWITSEQPCHGLLILSRESWYGKYIVTLISGFPEESFSECRSVGEPLVLLPLRLTSSAVTCPLQPDAVLR